TPRTAPPQKEGRRLKKRILIPGLIVGLLALLLLWAVVRGTWADTTPRDPKTSEEGIVCHLYQNPDGRKVVRCAKVLDYPAEQVWAVVTDYEHFDEIFPTVESGKIQGKDKGRFQWNGEVTSLVGTWKVELDITHKESTDKKVASWKGTGEGVSVLEGS